MHYEIINPSDPYTFLADSREAAALVIFLLGPAYAAEEEQGGDDTGVPLFLFGGAEEWYKETFGRSPAEGIEALESSVSAALESVMFGHFEDRRRYSAALDAIDDTEKRRRFIEKWQDGHSSLNDIGTRCHAYAEAIKKKREEAAT